MSLPTAAHTPSLPPKVDLFCVSVGTGASDLHAEQHFQRASPGR